MRTRFRPRVVRVALGWSVSGEVSPFAAEAGAVRGFRGLSGLGVRSRPCGLAGWAIWDV